MSQAIDDAKHAAARKVGSADGSVEEGVARECHVLLLAVEGYAAVAVAWGLDDLEFMITEFDDFIFLEEVADRRVVGVQLHLVEGFCLVLESLHQFLVPL